jgi:hypothetical protein
MPEESEQIGDLIYVPNPDYPYPFEVERPPHFWMTEQSGQIEAAVDAYLNGDPLTPAAIDVIKQYMRQYIERALMSGAANRGALLRQIPTLHSTHDIERFAEAVAEYGVELF